VEAIDFLLTEFFFCFGPDRGVVRHLEADQVPEDAGEFVSHGGDGFRGTQSGFPAAETISQIILGAPEALGGQAQSQCGAGFDIAGFDGDDAAAGDAVIGTEAQPGGEGFGGGKALDEVGPQFGEEDQGGVDLETGDLSEVDAGQAVEFGAGVEGGLIALGGFVLESGRRERVLAEIALAVEGGQ